MEDIIKLRQRFADDFNLPVSVLEDPYFSYQLELYNPYNSAKRKWEELLSLVKTSYAGYSDLLIQDYYHMRDVMICGVEKLPAYKEFITADMSKYSVHDPKFKAIPTTSVYTEANAGKYFISIDIQHANFQMLRYFNPVLVNNAANYEEFIQSHFTDFRDNHPLLSYLVQSKYTRQVVFGKLNMSRNITIQNYTIYRLWLTMCDLMQKYGRYLKIYSKASDELIFEWTDNFDISFLKDLYQMFQLPVNDIQFHMELFQLHAHKFETSVGQKMLVYEKTGTSIKEINKELWTIPNNTGLGNIKSCPNTYFPQVYKLLTGGEITPQDLVFCYEKNLCQFLKPIKMIV